MVEDGIKSAIEPCAAPLGARVEARDLFAATPARLKFLKSDRAEALAAADAVKRLAMAAPEVALFVRDRHRLRLRLAGRGRGRSGLHRAAPPGARRRVRGQFGRARREPRGRAAYRPGGSADLQPAERLAAVPVRQRAGGARQDARRRAARAPISISCPPTGTRSRLCSSNASRARSTSTSTRPRPKCAFATPGRPQPHRRRDQAAPERGAASRLDHRRDGDDPRHAPAATLPRRVLFAPLGLARFARGAAARRAGAGELRRSRALRAGAGRSASERDLAAPLGAARAQVHENYIIAQTKDGVVIVDQHAAHERIVYEKLKREREQGAIERQTLLTPLVVDLDPDAAALIDAHAEELAGLGLIVEGFGPGAMMVREAPAAIAQGDLAGLVRDLAADLAAEDGAQTLARRLDQRLATFACHHSVRSGRALKPEEMNALLREMEATPGAGQCNHGRPTYVELKLADIERLFGRR